MTRAPAGITRRGLLLATAGTAVATATVACTDEPPPAGASGIGGNAPPFDPMDWPSVRAQFVLDPAKVNFASFYFASHPATVRAAIDKHRAGLDANPLEYLLANEPTLDTAVFTAAASYLNTEPEQIALTDSTTMGLGLLYTGLRLAPGDEVLTTEHDFYATHESFALRKTRDGLSVRRVRLYDEPSQADADDMVARLVAAIGPQTRVVAITWVHSSTGVMLPVRAMADALAGVNQDRPTAQRALLCVDGVHGLAADAATPGELGCDFLVAGTHKWLFGPRGTGIIWGRPEAWDRYTPVIPSFIGGSGDGAGRWATPGGFHSFEHRWALAEAFAFHQAIGPARVADRTRELAAAMKEGLAGIPKVRLHTPRGADISAGIVCCEVSGYNARQAVARLGEANIVASTTPYTPSYLRFGPNILTNESDVEKALAAVRAL
jgi:selenocysteine lyase/cysteine desulfurase